MADRVLRGSRLGSTSYEADRNHDLAPRRTATYRCPRDHEFTVPMADDAEVPAVWDCRMHGLVLDADRRLGARGQGRQAAAHPLGHAAGAPLHRGTRRDPQRAAHRAEEPPHRILILTGRHPQRATPPTHPGERRFAFQRPLRPCCRDRTGPGTGATGASAPQTRDLEQRLPDDAAAHLRLADLPFGEGDRHLGDPEPGLHRPPGQVDLEAVARARRPGPAAASAAPRPGRPGSRR